MVMLLMEAMCGSRTGQIRSWIDGSARSDEHEVVCGQLPRQDTFQRQAVRGIEGNHSIVPDLTCRRKHVVETIKQALAERNHIVVAKVGHDVMPEVEAEQECVMAVASRKPVVAPAPIDEIIPIVATQVVMPPPAPRP